ncbi:MAG TPA: hypothetical protein ENJ34_01325 [Epsilonproteobacteria bacterium]|nr:hypothetical protein [Campylobacterota bacterium]
MRLKGTSLSFVVNFLLGVAWATAFLGAMSIFFSNYPNSFPFTLFASVFAMVPGLVAVLCLEHFITSKEKLHLLETQTKLLQALLDKEPNL